MRQPRNTRALLIGYGLLVAALILAAFIIIGSNEKWRDSVLQAIRADLHRSKFRKALNSFSDDKPQAKTYKTDPVFLGGDTNPPAVLGMQLKKQDIEAINQLSAKMDKRGGMRNQDKKWFPAKFVWKGNSYEGKVRVRGDLFNHWRNPKKSWRIKLKKGSQIEGYREFDIILPWDKALEVERVSNDLSRKVGLIAPDSGFTVVNINGVNMGPYFWMETHSPAMIERHKRPPGEIFRENNTWLEMKLAGLDKIDISKTRENITLQPYNFKTTFNEPGITQQAAKRWEHFLWLIREADDRTFYQQIPQYLDLELYMRWNAITWLAGSLHSHWGDNLRWYYDNTTGKFEPLLYDIFRYYIDLDGDSSFEDADYKGKSDYTRRDYLITRLMKNPEYRTMRNRILWQYLNDPEMDFGARCSEMYNQIKPILYQGNDSVSMKYGEKFHAQTLDVFNKNSALLKQLLSFARLAVTPGIISSADNKGKVLQLHLYTDATSQIAIEKINLTLNADYDGSLPTGGFTARVRKNQDKWQDVKITCNSRQGKDGPELIFTLHKPLKILTDVKNLSTVRTTWDIQIIPSKANEHFFSDPTRSAAVSLDGYNTVTDRKLQPFCYQIAPLAHQVGGELSNVINESAQAAIARSGLPWKISKDKPNTFVLPAGEYTLKQTWIAPPRISLKLQPGVTIKMAPGVSLLTYKPLTAVGTADKPISIIRSDKLRPWAAFSVINAKGTSHLEYVTVDGGYEDRLAGLYTSGQINFYRSDVIMKNCTVRNGSSDDGLNVKRAKIMMSQCLIQANASDGFDGDWVSGEVVDTTFAGNRGDGLDLSGSKLIVRNCLMKNTGDKAFSIGEHTEIDITDSIMRGNNIGLAAKDSSDVRMVNSVFYQNTTAITVYRKKPLFKIGGNIKLNSCLFWDNKKLFQMDINSKLELVDCGSDKWKQPQRMELINLEIVPCESQDWPVDNHFAMKGCFQGHIAQQYEIGDSNVSYTGPEKSAFVLPARKCEDFFHRAKITELPARAIGVISHAGRGVSK